MFAPTTLPVRARVILVLDAEALAERGAREVRDVARGEDVVAAARAAALVDDDAVVDRQARGLCELDRRDDAEAGDDGVGLEHAARAERDATFPRRSRRSRPARTSTPFSR